MKCECEHNTHFENGKKGCVHNALFLIELYYGRFEICYDCMAAKHMISDNKGA